MKMSIYWPPLLAAVFLPAMAHAGLPQLNATCPDKIEVHADKGGPVYIDGKEAKLKKVNENYFEAKGSGVTVSISINPDGSPDVSYTGKHGRNGVCQLADTAPMEKPHTNESSASHNGGANARARDNLPRLNATCPGKIEVHADKGGPVFIDGKEAKLKTVNENYFEAKGSGVTVSISVNRDGSPDVSYTGKHGRNGVCQVGDKTPMEKPHKAESSSSQMVAVADMPRYCAGEASAKFHKRPTEITTKPAVEDGGMYIVYGEFPGSGRDPAVFTCTFTKAGKLVEVDDQ